MAFSLIAIGMVLQGIGKSPRYPFVTLYIDDTVEKRETGFYMGEFYLFRCLFDLILYVPSTIFQLNKDESSWVEPVLS